jgi:pimeloyl-ACP methyl ester carboxylesterase
MASAGGGTTIAVGTGDVEGLTLHYLTAGRGPAVVLLHGYAETSRMWRPLIPRLATNFMLIAPDLPGIGDSDIPKDGLDMTWAANRIHSLVRGLGIERAAVVGHDIGLMVAYAYAAQYPAETERLVLMDAFVPGVEGWEAIYNNQGLWHFRFHGPTPETLVKGRERTYLDYYWNDFAADKTRSIPETDRQAYAAAYARPGRMQAAWAYFESFPQAAKDFAQFSRTRLTMPVLSVGGQQANGDALGQQARLVASNATTVTLPDTGHWLMEEQPEKTIDALVKFLEANSIQRRRQRSSEGASMANGSCTHLAAISSIKRAKQHECEECVKIGSSWVHLRTCQSCGVTLCCDNSRNRHATKHARATSHPVIASAEPGEQWLYCYPDDAFLEY